MVTVTVMVYADARREAVKNTDKDEYQIFVREPASRNLANMRVREIIAGEYGVPIHAVTIQTGHRSPKKRLVINDKIIIK